MLTCGEKIEARAASGGWVMGQAGGSRREDRLATGQTKMGAGQVARVARWRATLKASGNLRLLDGGAKNKGG